MRIERFWRDIYIGSTSLFYHLFYHLEDCGILHCEDTLHLWCLHYIYIQYINHTLSAFVSAWSQHSLRSAQDMSPLQVWMHGMLSNYNSGHRITEELYHQEDYVSGTSSVLDDVELNGLLHL